MSSLLPFVEPRSTELEAAIDTLATAGGLEERGAVFTKTGVVEAILDLCGYTVDAELESKRLLEPSFGDGEFLLAAVQRLVESFSLSGIPKSEALDVLTDSIRGVELHRETYEATAKRVISQLVESGIDDGVAQALAQSWLCNDDFLLADLGGSFDFVVGNPPYVRQERIPNLLLETYKRRFATLYDRADLYVLFYERGMDLLDDGGVLGFICANRWIKNKYGGPLRRKVGAGFNLKYFIDLERADVFHSEVIAYPAITVIQRSSAKRTRVALGNRESGAGLDEVVVNLTKRRSVTRQPRNGNGISDIDDVPNDKDPWLLDAPHVLHILRSLECRLPALEEDGAKVGIGVATGADRVFIQEYDAIPVETARKLRLAMASNCVDGAVAWGGKGVVNPYLESGQLAAFDEFPLFAAYMEQNGEALKRRHTAKKQPNKWYKTIDRIYPQLVAQPKLLIPDIKGEATVAYDAGQFYPHHNLYVVTSDTWDLRALQAILRSSVALMFVAAYCVRMSGGFLRFQAQYLRRIRCPRFATLSRAEQGALASVATEADQDALDSVVLPLYGLSESEAAAVVAYARDARVLRKGQ